MFTGIIESVGKLERVEPIAGDRRFTVVATDGYLDDLSVGDSVAVSGICLTAVTVVAGGFTTDVSVETLSATIAGGWRDAQPVNLERAATPLKPLGGHLVSGHVDGVARLLERHEEARSRRLLFAAPAPLSRYIARKGSVTLDGVSLTVNAVDENRFGVNIIPHTWEQTTLGALQPGCAVNLEVDQVARYLERLLEARGGGCGVDQ